MGLLGAPDVRKMESKRDLKGLSKALLHEQAEVRREAAAALDLLGWQPGRDEAGAAFWALKGQWERCAQIGGPALVGLVQALQDPTSCQPAAQAISAICSAWNAADKSWFQPAAQAIMSLRRPIKEREGEVRRLAIEAIAQLGAVVGNTNRLAECAGWSLVDLFKDADESIRDAAMVGLVTIGPQSRQPLVLTAQSLAEDYEVRTRAVETLGRIGDDRAIAVLEKWLQDKDRSIRVAAAVALLRNGQTNHAEIVQEGVRDIPSRRRVIKILCDSKLPQATDLLLYCLEWADLQEHSAVCDALVEIGQPAVELLIDTMNQDSSLRRYTLATILARIGGPRAMEATAGLFVDRDDRKYERYPLDYIEHPQARQAIEAYLAEQARHGAAAQREAVPIRPEAAGKSVREWCDEGNSLGSRGLYREALACFEKALLLDPGDALTWFNVGVTQMNLGDKAEAIGAFEKFLQYAPPEAQLLHVPAAQGYIAQLRG